MSRYERWTGCVTSVFGLSRKALVSDIGHWPSAIDISVRCVSIRAASDESRSGLRISP